MWLTLRIPQSESETLPLALSLARAAPMFQMTDGGPPAYLVAFPDLSLSFDLAERLIGAAAELPGVQVSIDGQPVEGLTKFLNVLRCYRDSLAVPDPQGHCASRAARVGEAGGCPDRTCVSHCQFICSRCLGVAREPGAPPISVQLREIARQAEVDWCPNLRML